MICTYCGNETSQNPCMVCGAPLQGQAMQVTGVQQAPAYTPQPAPQQPWQQAQPAYQQQPGYQQPAAYQQSYQPLYAPGAYGYGSPAAYTMPYTPPAPPLPKRLHSSVSGTTPITIIGFFALLVSIAGPIVSIWLLVDGIRLLATGLVSGIGLNYDSLGTIGLLWNLIFTVGGAAMLLFFGLLLAILPPIFLLVGAPSVRGAPRRARVMFILSACFGGVGLGLCSWGVYSAVVGAGLVTTPHAYAGHVMLAATLLLLLFSILSAIAVNSFIRQSTAAYLAEQ